MKKYIFLLMIVIIFVGTGCMQKKPVYEENLQPEAYFCATEDCEAMLIQLINTTNSTIHCAFYELSLHNLMSAFKNSKADVMLVFDDNVGNLPFNYRKDTDSQLMHNKFCIFGNSIVWTGSYNPSQSGKQNDNNVVVFHSKYLAQNYEDEFEEMWNGDFSGGSRVAYPIAFISGKKVENYFCPEDSCAEHLKDALMQANKSIYFMTFSFTDDSIGDILLAKHAEGIEVKGVFEKRQESKWSEYSRMKNFSRLDHNKYTMHHKVFIIDNETVATGSYNPTANGDKNNDENMVIIHDKAIAGKFTEEFWRVWETEEESNGRS